VDEIEQKCKGKEANCCTRYITFLTFNEHLIDQECFYETRLNLEFLLTLFATYSGK